MIFSKIEDKNRRSFLNAILGVNSVDNLGNYLGVPSEFSRNKSKKFGPILHKIGKVLQSWKRSLFSVAGKEILIKAVGLAIPSYIMSVFKTPKGVCEEIMRKYANFWWGSSAEKKKLHWCR